ncbi:hypothetical protein V8C44DRAFT_330412 [Trichoderma aethiopicum]
MLFQARGVTRSYLISSSFALVFCCYDLLTGVLGKYKTVPISCEAVSVLMTLWQTEKEAGRVDEPLWTRWRLLDLPE